MQLAHGCPHAPVIEGYKLKVHETIRKRIGHSEDDRTILFAITRSDDRPTIRKLILTNLPIEDDLIQARLHDGRRRIEFIEKQHTRLVTRARKKRRRKPLRAITHNSRNATKIGGIQEWSANVNKRFATIPRKLRDDRRLPNARRSPNERWPTCFPKWRKCLANL